ncbi:uncharacterized protein LOC131230433 [Magnolia sinica]|uniref:uncharacterized protein LOC131230433 n=1 Tax=Magnolia sinica TaxID=86752 RepID=UPI00265A5F31|nr:uncharacterized protein LOC131230433 [Magnolia sinica]
MYPLNGVDFMDVDSFLHLWTPNHYKKNQKKKTGREGKEKEGVFRDLRLALLVNEFADSDVDSLLLDSTHLNAAFNLSTVSLTHGCGCCDVSGPFRESLQRIVDSKHNFDGLLVETSGLEKPEKFVAELEEVGINLDWIIAVVDAESLPKILSMDVVKQQLQHVDLPDRNDHMHYPALSIENRALMAFLHAMPGGFYASFMT